MFGLKSIIKLFEGGNVCVDGMKGRGKDMLTGNIIARRKKPYISNLDYKCKKSVYIPLDFSRIDPKNNYKQLVSKNIVPYEYPYPEDCDLYVSDAGVYFPAQYCNELNKQYANMPVFQALSRHLGNCNFHVNVQNLNRVWDKIREQSDIYIKCNRCRVMPIIRFPGLRWLSGLVFQIVTIYDNYQACVDRVEPFRPLHSPILANREQRNLMRTKNEEMKRNFLEAHGHVKRRLLIYRNITGYDTRLFKTILKGGPDYGDENENKN